MKRLIIVAALAVTSTVFAAEVNVGRTVLGSGTPSNVVGGTENAKVVDNAKVENNILHAPQYMPHFPTAATIWPRVVEVPCKTDLAGNLSCASYNWSPALGPAEYLFVTPKVVQEPKPVIRTVVVPGPVVVKEVLVEVKKKKE